MDALFKKEEIIQFLVKKGEELQGECLIRQALSKPLFRDDENDISFVAMVERIHEWGVEDGIMVGKIKLIEELIEKFKLDK